MPPTVILTRPDAQSRDFAAALGDIACLIAPLMGITPLAVTADLAGLAHVIFTSRNGVAQARRLGIPPTATAWCVGDQTTAAARAEGFVVQNAKGGSADLLRLMLAQRPKGPIAHIHGTHVAGDVAGGLANAGMPCTSITAYDQVALEASPALIARLNDPTPVIVPLFSPRAAKLFGAVPQGAAPQHVIVISSTVESMVDWPVQSLQTAQSADKKSMIATTLTRFAAISPSNMP